VLGAPESVAEAQLPMAEFAVWAARLAGFAVDPAELRLPNWKTELVIRTQPTRTKTKRQTAAQFDATLWTETTG